MRTALKRQLDDVMADIKRLSATVQQKLKGHALCICAVFANMCFSFVISSSNRIYWSS